MSVIFWQFHSKHVQKLSMILIQLGSSPYEEVLLFPHELILALQSNLAARIALFFVFFFLSSLSSPHFSSLSLPFSMSAQAPWFSRCWWQRGEQPTKFSKVSMQILNSFKNLLLRIPNHLGFHIHLCPPWFASGARLEWHQHEISPQPHYTWQIEMLRLWITWCGVVRRVIGATS